MRKAAALPHGRRTVASRIDHPRSTHIFDLRRLSSMSIRTVEGPCTAAYNPGSRNIRHDYEPGFICIQSCRCVRSRQGQFGYSCLARWRTKRRRQAAIRKALMAEMRGNAEASLGPLLVVCEATGGYERHVLDVCKELGIAAHKAHGSRVRHFARYLGFSPRPIRSTPACSPSMGCHEPSPLRSTGA